MHHGFWEQLDTPIFALAPMEDVTDVAFREMFARYGKPDVMFTEFTSADGLLKGGWGRLKHQLWYTNKQRPIVAQLFSDDPDAMQQAARLCRNLGFDGVDINMCCPSKTVCQNGCGSALIKAPQLAKKIIEATQAGAEDIPVSVKTRIGFDEDITERWIGHLLETELAAISIHARIRADMSNTPARWDAIKEAVKMRDKKKADTLIIGNGDVWDHTDAEAMIEQTGCDGVMIARGAFGTPWFFKDETPTIRKQLEIMYEHARLYAGVLGNRQNFRIMRKHFKAYAKGFPHAKDLRKKLMQTDSVAEVEQVRDDFLSNNLQEVKKPAPARAGY